MGGFSAQVQQPQTGQPAGGKMGHLADQAAKSGSQQMTNAQLDASNATYSAPGGPGAALHPKDSGMPAPMGKGGAQTNPSTSGQPRMGMPNQYSNTVGQWDNAQIQQPSSGGGKGKG